MKAQITRMVKLRCWKVTHPQKLYAMYLYSFRVACALAKAWKTEGREG